MNIAITTWHSGPNAGTFFQLYGLYSYLESRGHHVEVINYDNRKEDFIARGWKYYMSQPIALIRRKIKRKNEAKAAIIAEAPYKTQLTIRDKRFKEMYRLMQLTEPVRTDEDFAKLNQRFDAFVVGSDQIWNAGMLNRRYFLDFVDKGKIKASYCPSMGSGLVMKRQREVFKSYLSNYNYISVREKALKEILEEELDRPVFHLLDPSMLILRDDYLKMAHLPEELEPNSYLLCYFMPKNERQVEMARQYAKSKGLKFVIMAMHPFSFTIKDAYIYAEAGPKEFVGLIANAAIVFSSSFHCTIFSIMLHKDLYVFEQSFTSKAADINHRYIEQLETYNMTHRYIAWEKSVESVNELPIDYNYVEAVFQKRLQESKDFINQFA